MRIVSLEPRGLGDVLDNIRLVGELAGVAPSGRQVARKLAERVRAVAAPTGGVRARVGVLEWMDPVFAGGHWVPEMVAAAGGLDVLGVAGQPSRGCRGGRCATRVPTCSSSPPAGSTWRVPATRWAALLRRDGWCDLPAVRRGRVYLVASSYFSRPGPRLVDGLELLAAVLRGGGRPPGLPRGAVEQFAG